MKAIRMHRYYKVDISKHTKNRRNSGVCFWL